MNIDYFGAHWFYHKLKHLSLLGWGKEVFG